MTNYPPSLGVIEEHLAAVGSDLEARLRKARAIFAHAGNKGTYVEDAFRDVLRQFLPRSIGVGHGEVIDTHANRSSQMDAVIVCPEHPNWYHDGAGPSLFLIEGVAAVAEVKAVLASSDLDGVLKKAQAFRALTPDRSGPCDLLANDEDAARYYRSPAYFVFALESQLTLDAIADKLAQYPTGTRATETVDGVFVLNRGYVLNFGDGSSALTTRAPSIGAPLKGYYFDDSDALLMLMRWLLIALAVPLSQLPILPRYILAQFAKP